MARNQVITEHGYRTAAQSRRRIDLKLEVQAGVRRKVFPQLSQLFTVMPLIPQPPSAQKHVKFQIIVWPVTRRRSEHAAFAPAITTPQDQPANLRGPNARPHPARHQLAELFE